MPQKATTTNTGIAVGSVTGAAVVISYFFPTMPADVVAALASGGTLIAHVIYQIIMAILNHFIPGVLTGPVVSSATITDQKE